MAFLKSALSYFKQSFKEWQKDDAFGKSAALAYYTVFSLPGLLIIIITVAGLVLSTQEVQDKVTGEVSSVAGPEAARQVETIITNSQQNASSTFALIAGVATMIFGATGVFFQLQKSLNDAWEVERKPGSGIKEMLMSRLTALVLVLAIGLLLMFSMLLTTVVSLMSGWIQQNLIDVPAPAFFLVQEVASLVVFTFLFALIFKVLPDVEMEWRSVWPGALITALLFTLGKFLLGFYFGKVNPTAAFGAAGSVVLFLLWAYYSALIFLFGAEFTQVYTRRKEHPLTPSGFARYKVR